MMAELLHSSLALPLLALAATACLGTVLGLVLDWVKRR